MKESAKFKTKMMKLVPRSEVVLNALKNEWQKTSSRISWTRIRACRCLHLIRMIKSSLKNRSWPDISVCSSASTLSWLCQLFMTGLQSRKSNVTKAGRRSRVRSRSGLNRVPKNKTVNWKSLKKVSLQTLRLICKLFRRTRLSRPRSNLSFSSIKLQN